MAKKKTSKKKTSNLDSIYNVIEPIDKGVSKAYYTTKKAYDYITNPPASSKDWVSGAKMGAVLMPPLVKGIARGASAVAKGATRMSGASNAVTAVKGLSAAKKTKKTKKRVKTLKKARATKRTSTLKKKKTLKK